LLEFWNLLNEDSLANVQMRSFNHSFNDGTSWVFKTTVYFGEIEWLFHPQKEGKWLTNYMKPTQEYSRRKVYSKNLSYVWWSNMDNDLENNQHAVDRRLWPGDLVIRENLEINKNGVRELSIHRPVSYTVQLGDDREVHRHQD
jgi:hypothetical protein